jgi:iron complex outermembrane recepter protein
MSLLLDAMTASIATAGRLAVLCCALVAELALAGQASVQNPSDLHLNPSPGKASDGAPKSYAQDLVEQTAARHPELTLLEIEAKPPDDLDSLIIASTDPRRVRKKSSSEAIRVFETGMPHVESNGGTGQVATVSVRLQDVSRRPIGTLTISQRFAPGTEANALITNARNIADELQPQIPSLQRLVEPVALTPGEEEEVEEEQQEEALPLTKAVVKGEALEDAKQEGYSEAIKNVAGVSPANSKGTPNDSVNIRGIKLNLFSNYRLNGGLSTAGVLTVPTENKEKIETLKGANALMFGIASPAGIINLITKRAGPVDLTTVSWLANSFGQLGGSVDISRRFLPDKQLGVRLNGSLAQLENGVRNTRGDGEFVSLGLDWKATSRLTLQGDVEYFAKHVPEQAGINLLPVINDQIQITKVPNPRNLLSGTWAKLRADTKNFQVRGDYVLLDGLKILAEIGRSYAYRSRFTTRISEYDPDTGANGRVRINSVHQIYLNKFERVELISKFSTWFLTHHLTFGGSISVRKADTPYQNNVDYGRCPPGSLCQNIFNPIELPAPVFNGNTPLPNQISTETGLYVYDTITVIPQVRLLGGFRLTWDREETRQGVPPQTTRVGTPAVGALWDILPNLTLFGSYMEGLEAGATAPVQADNRYAILPPAVSTQKEIGIRFSTLRGLATNVSAFQITRANAITDPTTNIFAENGNIDYKGIEATLTVEVARPLTVGAAGQWLRAIQNSPDTTINGKHPENTPSALGNVWIAIRPPWTPGLTLNAGASAIAKRFVDPQNHATIPGYTLFTAGLGYQMRSGSQRAVFLVSVDNLTNLRYWNSVQTGTYGIGMDRSVKMSARLDF